MPDFQTDFVDFAVNAGAHGKGCHLPLTVSRQQRHDVGEVDPRTSTYLHRKDQA